MRLLFSLQPTSWCASISVLCHVLPAWSKSCTGTGVESTREPGSLSPGTNTSLSNLEFVMLVQQNGSWPDSKCATSSTAPQTRHHGSPELSETIGILYGVSDGRC